MVMLFGELLGLYFVLCVDPLGYMVTKDRILEAETAIFKMLNCVFITCPQQVFLVAPTGPGSGATFLN